MVAGTPILFIVSSSASVAVDIGSPVGRLKEMVVAAKVPWWLTWVGVVPLPKWAKAASGTIASCAVDTAAPVEAPPLVVLASALAAALRAASLATAAALGAAVLVRTVVPATALV